MAKKTLKKPFTFKDGTTILVRPLQMTDYKELDEWVRSEYMRNVSSALKVLGSVERQTFLMAALDRVSSLTFQYGLGSEIINGNAFGLCRLAYQLIDNPPFTFEGFVEKLFPGMIFSEEGIQTVVTISNMVYEDAGVAVDRDKSGKIKMKKPPIQEDIGKVMKELNEKEEDEDEDEIVGVEHEEMID
ncbi:MAG: hypothetical protein ACOX6D_10585 [Thermoguttaceae bacterium]|jgi:hypothetical protein